MARLPDAPELPGYVPFLKEWKRVLLRNAFAVSAGVHLAVFGYLANGVYTEQRVRIQAIHLPRLQSTRQLYFQNVPIIDVREGGGGQGVAESAPGPGEGPGRAETPPLAVPVPVPDDLLSDPEATIVSQDLAEYAGLISADEPDSSLGGGGGSGGGIGGGIGRGGGTGVGDGFGPLAFQTPPRPVKIIVPGYPKSLERQAGKVLFLILIDESGTVVDDRVIESTYSAAMDSVASLAVRQSRFIPAKQNGKSIRAWTRYEISFGRNVE